MAKKSDFWGPNRNDHNRVLRAVKACGAKQVVDIGGRSDNLFPLATESIGWEGTHKLDLDHDRLPYDDGSVDFVYCRHTLEDLANPGHLLAEIQRVAKAGWLETPSPQAELTRGVDASGDHVGYAHHRWVCYVQDGVFTALPKYPVVERMPLVDSWHALIGGEGWNTRHLFEAPLRFKVLRNEIDFNLSLIDARGVRQDYLYCLDVALEQGAKG